jgi:glycine dehydrogenase subunit 1
MPFIPHTADDVRDMLEAIGAPTTEALFDEIPAELRAKSLGGIPAALSEMEIGRLMLERAAADGQPLNFIGAGAYEHHVPAAVWAIVTRGEYYSAYTPYQAEASQGTLQLLYEYQSMMSSLTGMAASNASLYDGATAVAEACLMAVRAHRKSKSQRVLVPAALNPAYRDVLQAIAGNQNLAFELLPYDPKGGQTTVASLEKYRGQDITALVIQQPNFFGTLEDVDALTDWAHQAGMLVIGVVNPVSLAVLKPPGEWGQNGADIVCGEGQPLGVPLSSGGPYFGFMTTRMEHIRQMPGRIVGRTVDLDGKPGFTLTLQAREQHIRRSKATSNICTNQGLLVTAATIYMSLVGPRGLAQVAATSIERSSQLVHALTRVPGVRLAFDGPRFHEAVLLLDRPVRGVLEALAARGIVGGCDISADYPSLGNALLVCATETRTARDIETYARALAEVMQSVAAA